MPSVTIEKELYQQLEAIAQQQQADLNTVASDAFRLYLWEQSRRKIAKESAVYRRRFSEIRQQYLGQYVAMHQGEIVDAGEDFQTLSYNHAYFPSFPALPVILRNEEERINLSWLTVH